MSVAVLCDPASPEWAIVPGLKPGTPGTVVMVIHGGCREHSLGDSTVFHSQRNIARIWNNHCNVNNIVKIQYIDKKWIKTSIYLKNMNTKQRPNNNTKQTTLIKRNKNRPWPSMKNWKFYIDNCSIKFYELLFIVLLLLLKNYCASYIYIEIGPYLRDIHRTRLS